jgi:lipoprotein-anchoring transpeptidase ErfK/SrfK
MMRVCGRRVSNTAISTERFWQIAILTAAGAIGAISNADAALYYWQDPDPGLSRPAPPVQPSRQRAQHRRSPGKPEAAQKETGAKPQGPLIIAVSIDNQKVRIFDDHGVFAEAPVSTGMRGHPTPTGVFSVIQKHKLHHSNIYSGAPMPYMQRITWSGVAMHAGVLPGYPASHGCIRMPMSFAVKMWNWTKMGARVFVTPGEIMTPVSISHPLLATMKVVPQPVAASEPVADKPVAVKADKGAEAKPASSQANLELRSTVGHIDAAKPGANEASDSRSLQDQTHTADASRDTRVITTPTTMSDASAGSNAPPREDAAARTDNTPPAINGTVADTGDASKTAAKSEPEKPDSDAAAAKHDETVAVDNKPAESTPAEAKRAEAKPSDANPTEATSGASKPVETEAATAGVEAEGKAEEKPAEAKIEAAKVEAKPAEAKPDDKVKAAAIAADAKKDQARLADINKPVVAKSEPPKRTGQIAVFISRKDSKIYVRQNFAPLFEAPVTIAASDRPLGTHVFTAEADKNDANVLHWSVVSLPMSAKSLQRSADEERQSRRRNKVAAAGPVEVKPLPLPDSPAEALDRITIPADAMARITEALTTGSSIIVSDQGINQGETGEGTDFIVSLR